MLYKTLSVKKIQKLDEDTIKKYGVPSLILMENAGRTISNEIRRLLKSRIQKSACVVCGIGNNAGDGFVAARHLLDAGFDVSIYVAGSAKKLKVDAKKNYQILKNLKYSIKEVKNFSAADINTIKGADVVVDAIFGVGLNRKIIEPFKSIIETLNHEANRIISVDIPSGLDGTTGKTFGACIRANRTVSFTVAKKGFFVNDGPAHTGKVIVRDIGIPKKLIDRIK